jgi:DNA-binding transcriptional ArsR family regulator
MPYPEPERARWSLTTPHARVLMCIAADPTVRVRDISDATGLALRTVQAILRQLETDGALERRRNGRRNVYRIIGEYRPTDPIESAAPLGDWLGAIRAQEPDRDRPPLSRLTDHSIGSLDGSAR